MKTACACCVGWTLLSLADPAAAQVLDGVRPALVDVRDADAERHGPRRRLPSLAGVAFGEPGLYVVPARADDFWELRLTSYNGVRHEARHTAGAPRSFVAFARVEGSDHPPPVSLRACGPIADGTRVFAFGPSVNRQRERITATLAACPAPVASADGPVVSGLLRVDERLPAGTPLFDDAAQLVAIVVLAAEPHRIASLAVPAERVWRDYAAIQQAGAIQRRPARSGLARTKDSGPLEPFQVARLNPPFSAGE